MWAKINRENLDVIFSLRITLVDAECAPFAMTWTVFRANPRGTRPSSMIGDLTGCRLTNFTMTAKSLATVLPATLTAEVGNWWWLQFAGGLVVLSRFDRCPPGRPVTIRKSMGSKKTPRL